MSEEFENEQQSEQHTSRQVPVKTRKSPRRKAAQKDSGASKEEQVVEALLYLNLSKDEPAAKARAKKMPDKDRDIVLARSDHKRTLIP